MNLKNDKTLSLTFDCCQIKSNEKIFFANKSGVQSFGILANLNPKRKTNFVESKWGKIQPFKDTMNEQQMNLILSDLTPRFFAVRSDLSSTEFVHENFFMNKTRNLTQKNKEFILLNQKFNIITTHDIKTLNNNKAYLKHDFIDKITRNNILRKLQIPKSSSRRKRNLDEAKEDVNQILSDQIEFNLFFHDLREKIQQIMKENEKVYLEEINPKVEPPEIIRVPVLTPEPRLQIAQSQMNFVKRNKPLNYWLSPESEFVVLPECKKCLPKPIPKSAKLYDMPDPNVRMDKPPKDPVSFRPTKMIISPRRPADLGFYKTEVSRPQTTSKQDYVDFGDVKLGKKAHAQFILTNIGKAPLKYSFSKPKNTSVRVLTVPGIVAPGLKLKIKLEIEPKKIGEIDTYFLLISNQGEMKIPVYGNVIK